MSFAAFDDAPTGTDPFAASDDADPAADFLARQQNQLADLESDGSAGQYEHQENTGINNNNFHRYSPTEPANGASADYTSFGADDIAPPQNGGIATATAIVGDSVSSGFMQSGGSEYERNENDEEPSDPYSAIHREDRMQQEPEKIKRWREAFAQRITEKDAAEEKKRVEFREGAAKELVDWQRHYDEQLERQHAANREAEVAFIKQRDETTPGSEWERVCWLCDFNPKTSKQVKDVSRMRSLLLQLKQQQGPTQQ